VQGLKGTGKREAKRGGRESEFTNKVIPEGKLDEGEWGGGGCIIFAWRRSRDNESPNMWGDQLCGRPSRRTGEGGEGNGNVCLCNMCVYSWFLTKKNGVTFETQNSNG